MNTVAKMLLMLYVAAAVTAAEDSPCNCGVFKKPTPMTTTDSPLFSTTPSFPIRCETDGKEICGKMCMALAGAARATGPEMLCNIVGTTTEPFVPLIYSKSCGDAEWVNTGLTSDVKFCCDDKKVVSC